VGCVKDAGAGFPMFAGQGISEGCGCFAGHIGVKLYREDALNGAIRSDYWL
jgi:hypothetical protein